MAVALAVGEVHVVEVEDDTVNGVKDWSVRIVLASEVSGAARRRDGSAEHHEGRQEHDNSAGGGRSTTA